MRCSVNTWKMAWRNILRNKRRTTVTIAAMSVAVFITIVYSSLVAGMLVQLQSDTLDFELGAVQIFAPGFQDKPQGGLGIGLAVAKELLELQNGRIWVKSKEGVGSTFTFALPLAPA